MRNEDFNHRDFIDSQREVLDGRTVYIGWLKLSMCRPPPDGDYRFLTREQHLFIVERETLRMTIKAIEIGRRYGN